MDPDQQLLDDYNAREDAREAEEWRQRKAAQMRYEGAAKEAHKVRQMASLVFNRPMPDWDDLGIVDKFHATADAEAVAMNPSISESELWEVYRNRRITGGSTDHPDLQDPDETTKSIEECVLKKLKESLRL